MKKIIFITAISIVILSVAFNCSTEDPNTGPTTITYDFEDGTVPDIFTQTGPAIGGPDVWNAVDTSGFPIAGTWAAGTLASGTTSCLLYEEIINTSNVSFSFAIVNQIAFSMSFILKVDSVEVYNAAPIQTGWNDVSIDVTYGQHTFEWCFSANEDANCYIDDIVFTTSQ